MSFRRGARARLDRFITGGEEDRYWALAFSSILGREKTYVISEGDLHHGSELTIFFISEDVTGGMVGIPLILSGE